MMKSSSMLAKLILCFYLNRIKGENLAIKVIKASQVALALVRSKAMIILLFIHFFVMLSLFVGV